MTPEESARRAAARAARDSYGRLLALLSCRTRDIAAAEDALAEAFARALETWPVRGVPAEPDGWLLTTARRCICHGERHRQVHDAATYALELLARDWAEHAQRRDDTLPDHRLRLLFVCAHPAITEAARAPLMLQAVLGLDAATIARVFLSQPAAMSQMLVRTKRRIRDAGLPFEAPPATALAERLDDVLAAVYACFSLGWSRPLLPGGEAAGNDLTGEAIFLARLITTLLPQEPEAMGLLALLLYAEARREARRDATGQFVPLSQQDISRWSRDMLREAEHWLHRATQHRRFGRLQTEAAIQSLHVQERLTGRRHGEALASLYDWLAVHHPTAGILVNRALAHAEVAGAAASIAQLDALDADLGAYQPYWVVRAHVLTMAGRHAEAASATAHALALTDDPAEAHFIAATGSASEPPGRAGD